MAPETWGIEIKIFPHTKRGDQLRYDPYPIRAHPGDTIQWRCKHPFTVDLGFDTPFPKSKLPGKSNKNEYLTVAADGLIRPKTGGRRYKYTASVYYKSEIMTDDPEFIVERNGEE